AHPLGHHAPRRREQVGDRDAQRLREEEDEDHAAPSRRTAERSARRTSGTLATMARITTACRMSTISFGTSAFTASPPCERVAKKSAASGTPSGWLRPTSATAMPRKPEPAAKPSS